MAAETVNENAAEAAKRKIDFTAFREFVDEFANESDRAAVILGAARLDLLLGQILQKFLLPSTGKNDELLDGDSPLGTFSSKIMMCHRLGLINSDFCRALNLIRKIRNSFAHELSGISLSAGAHRDRIKELIAPMEKNEGFDFLLEKYFGKNAGQSGQFRCAVALATLRLEGTYDACPEINWKPFELVPVGYKRPAKPLEQADAAKPEVPFAPQGGL